MKHKYYMPHNDFQELSTLFFTTRSIIRRNLPAGHKADPNEWLRLETLRFVGDGAPTMRDIAEFLNIKASSATSLVQYLIRKKLLAAHPDENDKRRTRVSLTHVGKKRLEEYARRSAALMRTVFSPLGAKEVKELLRILELVRQKHTPRKS